MPRKARSSIITNFSHVIVQGIDRIFLFKENYFKKLYLNLLKKNLEDTNIEILAYCVMDNHVHILIYAENPEEVMSFMHNVNTGFAINYNKIKDRVGYVFRDRYYLQPITNECQLFNCLVYIHRNPIKANIVLNYEDYKFSSYKEYYNENGLITKKGKRLIFGTSYNYIKTFEKIHKDRIIEDITDIPEYQNADCIIHDFLIRYNKSIVDVKADKKLLKELLMKLKEEGGLSIRKMESILHIAREKIRMTLKK